MEVEASFKNIFSSKKYFLFLSSFCIIVNFWIHFIWVLPVAVVLYFSSRNSWEMFIYYSFKYCPLLILSILTSWPLIVYMLKFPILVQYFCWFKLLARLAIPILFSFMRDLELLLSCSCLTVVAVIVCLLYCGHESAYLWDLIL